MQHTFLRAERLKSEKVITRLFNKEGRSFSCYPLRLVWSEIIRTKKTNDASRMRRRIKLRSCARLNVRFETESAN